MENATFGLGILYQKIFVLLRFFSVEASSAAFWQVYLLPINISLKKKNGGLSANSQRISRLSKILIRTQKSTIKIKLNFKLKFDWFGLLVG